MTPPRTVAWLPGDGVGEEVTAGPAELLAVMAEAGRIELTGPWPVGASAFGTLGTGLPDGTLDTTDRCDAMFFGAAGEHPGVPLDAYRPEHSIIGLRRRYDLRVSIRSIIRTGERPIIVVRNLLGGAYGGADTRTESQGDTPAADQVILTVDQITELASMACDMVERGLASQILSVDKANLMATSRLWRRTTEAVAAERGVPLRHVYVDRMAFELAHDSVTGDTVILTEGIFGDILSDLAAGRAGSIALCGSASVNPSPIDSPESGDGRPAATRIAAPESPREKPEPDTQSPAPNSPHRCVGLFEPVHGSAPRHAGANRVNPTGAYMALIALLEWFDDTADLAPAVQAALSHALQAGPFTYDLSGPGATPVGTVEFAATVNAQALQNLEPLL